MIGRGGICYFLAALASCGFAGCHSAAGDTDPAARHAERLSERWLTQGEIRRGGIQFSKVAEQAVDQNIRASGRVTFDDQRVAHVFSPVTGRLIEIRAALGEHLTKGAPLAVIQSPDIGQVSAGMTKAKADWIAAEHDLRRKKELYETQAASAADYEGAEDAYRQAKAERTRAEEMAALLRAGGADLVTQRYTLTSPINGEVVVRSVNPGVEVQGQYTSGATAVELFTVGDLDSVWILADIYEKDLARVHTGAKVTVDAVAYPGKAFEGVIDWISGTLDPNTRTAKVRCVIDNPGHLLRPDMYATVLVAAEGRRVLAVPKESVVRVGTQTVVFLHTETASDGRIKLEQYPIAIDDTVRGSYQPVLHGPERGTEVVTQGAEALSEQM